MKLFGITLWIIGLALIGFIFYTGHWIVGTAVVLVTLVGAAWDWLMGYFDPPRRK